MGTYLTLAYGRNAARSCLTENLLVATLHEIFSHRIYPVHLLHPGSDSFFLKPFEYRWQGQV
jgi:hypothetical protein